MSVKVPPSAALETILQSAGLFNHLVTAEMGSSRAGNLFKLLEILRHRESEDMTSFAAAVEFMGEWVGSQPVEELSLTPGRREAVRLMNLHKAKGLEARVVWLANPAGVPDFEPERHVRRTDGTPRGHFRFVRPVGYQKKTVSQPVGWDESAIEESKYEEAEENRLMYVAATRARDLLVVSSYAGDLGEKKAWGPLERGFEGIPELPDHPPAMERLRPKSGRKDIVLRGEVGKGLEALRRKRARASMAGEIQETVTSLARREGEAPEWAKGGLGLWGAEVHVMLKALGESWPAGAPCAQEARLLRMARDVLAASGREPAAFRELAAHVAAIVRSPFWSRAMRAGRRLYEVPFSVQVRPGDAEYAELFAAIGPVPVAGGKPVVAVPGAPVFLSGAIDLLFREDDGWVIADYKTDRLPEALASEAFEVREKALGLLVDHYRPQVRLYSRFWAKITGERVKESGLYFTALDRWVRIGEGPGPPIG
jgi:ATP-dependent helicase/nuclease subunit A